MNIQEYIRYWNCVVRQWHETESPEFPECESFWDSVKYGKRGKKTFAECVGLQKELIPQPYWGNPEDCSVVVLNYNPGGSDKKGEELLVNDPSSHQFAKDADPTTLAGAIAMKYSKGSNYNATAREIPDLNENYVGFWNVKEHRAFWIWMKHRCEWVNRIFPEATKKPCFMEICAWHSHIWRNVAIPGEIMEILKRDFAPVLEEAILNSETKIGLAIGASFKDENGVLRQFGYEDISAVILDGKDAESKEETNRWYKVFRNPAGATIIVTWSQGSNRQPSKAFSNLERNLIQKNKNYNNNPQYPTEKFHLKITAK